MDNYKLPDTDQNLVEKVTNAQSFQNYMRTAVKEARSAKQSSHINLLITISGLQGSLWQFEKLIADVDDESESAEYVDVTEDVDVSPLWAMVYLNVKASTIFEKLLVYYLLTWPAINHFC